MIGEEVRIEVQDFPIGEKRFRFYKPVSVFLSSNYFSKGGKGEKGRLLYYVLRMDFETGRNKPPLSTMKVPRVSHWSIQGTFDQFFKYMLEMNEQMVLERYPHFIIEVDEDA